MKIKQSFIDRCGEITVNEIVEIARVSLKPSLFVTGVLLAPQLWHNSTEVFKATANVLKIDLKDIYEVEDLPHTL